MLVTFMMFGHSFVACLNNYLGTHNVDTTFDLPFSSNWLVLGACSSNLALERYLPIIQGARPQVLILELGTNDLADPACDSPEFVQQVVSLARKWIHDMAVKICVIYQIYSQVAADSFI